MNTKASTIDIKHPPLTSQYSYDKLNECPHCGYGQNSNIVASADFNTSIPEQTRLLVISYRCTRDNCDKAFFTVHIANHTRTNNGTGFHYYESELILVYPSICTMPDIFAKVSTISPTAVKIYNQAMEAKLHGLDELVGVGIRKSLDYLVYDYGKKRYANDPETTNFNDNPKTMLKARIHKFIESLEVNELAEACAWLGNDFTHPIRRHEAELDVLEQLARALFYHMSMMYEAWGAKASLGRPDNIDPPNSDAPVE